MNFQMNFQNFGMKTLTSTKPNIEYQIQQLIGQGTEGSVYKGKCMNLENVAIKYQPILKEEDISYKLATQEFKHLINVREIIKHQEGAYIIMDFADGELYQYMKLMEYIQKPVMEKLQLFLQIVRGVDELHKQNMIHRDLKPENVLYFKTANGQLQLKICDFGLTKQIKNNFQTANLGTPYYWAPELISEESQTKYTEMVDIWALGMILIEMLTGKPLLHQIITVEGIKNYYKGIQQQAINAQIESITILPNLKQILKEKLLVVNSVQRISAKDLVQELEKLIEASFPKFQFRQNNFQLVNNQSEQVLKIKPSFSPQFPPQFKEQQKNMFRPIYFQNKQDFQQKETQKNNCEPANRKNDQETQTQELYEIRQLSDIKGEYEKLRQTIEELKKHYQSIISIFGQKQLNQTNDQLIQQMIEQLALQKQQEIKSEFKQDFDIFSQFLNIQKSEFNNFQGQLKNDKQLQEDNERQMKQLRQEILKLTIQQSKTTEEIKQQINSQQQQNDFKQQLKIEKLQIINFTNDISAQILQHYENIIKEIEGEELSSQQKTNEEIHNLGNELQNYRLKTPNLKDQEDLTLIKEQQGLSEQFVQNILKSMKDFQNQLQIKKRQMKTSQKKIQKKQFFEDQFDNEESGFYQIIYNQSYQLICEIMKFQIIQEESLQDIKEILKVIFDFLNDKDQIIKTWIKQQCNFPFPFCEFSQLKQSIQNKLSLIEQKVKSQQYDKQGNRSQQIQENHRKLVETIEKLLNNGQNKQGNKNPIQNGNKQKNYAQLNQKNQECQILDILEKLKNEYHELTNS